MARKPASARDGSASSDASDQEEERSTFHTVTNTSTAPAHDSLIDRKSEFVADMCHVETLQSALAFVESVRQEHPKARHVTYAAIVGAASGNVGERMSDDGEPAGTAGRRILDVLRMNGLTDCVIAVTRYFGGILLGSGGLIRAYSTAAAMALKQADVVAIVPKAKYKVVLEYPWIGKFENIVEALGGECADRRFTDKVTLRVVMDRDKSRVFESRVREAFSARACVERLDQV